MKTEKFKVTGMTCAACEANITRNLKKQSGIAEVNVSLLANRMSVQYEEDTISSARIEQIVAELGYGAESEERETGGSFGQQNSFRSEWESRKKTAEDGQRAMKRRLISSLLILFPLMYIAMGGMMGLPVPSFFSGTENILIFALTQMFFAIPVMLINRHFFVNGLKALIKRSPNMDSLVAIGSGASFLYGVFAIYRMSYGLGHGDMSLVHRYAHDLYFESAAMILTLVTVGKFLEARSKSKTSDALGKLVDLAPKTATVVRNGAEQTIPAEQVIAGDIVVIRPGESIPVDGILTEGSGYVDQSAITGESIPVEKGVGDTVISATINKNGSFRFRASKVGSDTTLAQIIRLVDEAGNTKAPIARLADKVSGIFVPLVIGIAILTAFVWILAGESFEHAFSSAIAVLVISCPCALGLATPVAIMVGTGKAAEYGILIKSAESLENLHTIDTLVLDKTGTITSGHPSVTDIIMFDAGLCEREFLAAAAAVEAGSEHPLAEAVVERARAEGILAVMPERFEMIAGRGVSAELSGTHWLAGNAAFMREQEVFAKEMNAQTPENPAEEMVRGLAAEGKTPLFFARDGKPAGIIAVADTVRETSRTAIERFRKMGLQVVMLTGDNRLTAEAIRAELGLSEAISEVLPTEKEAHVRALQEKGHKVAMVGDGINDAPALTRADIGIAIGAGTDVAIDSADVVLMKDSLLDVATAIELSRAVVRNIHMNLFWAFFYNILGIPVAAGALFPLFGIRLSPMIGSAAMSLSSVCVVTNALRLRFFRPKEEAAEAPAQPERKLQAEDSGRTEVNKKENENENENKALEDSREAGTMAEKGEKNMKKLISVEGMMCGHCQKHVEKALSELSGVTSVEVSLERKEAEVAYDGSLTDEALCEAVTEAGYEVTGIREA